MSTLHEAMTVFPTRAPHHHASGPGQATMASSACISAPSGMLPYTLCGKNRICPARYHSLGTCKWYSRTSNSQGGSNPPATIIAARGAISHMP